MIAYKGFNKDLTCTCGRGAYQYHPGKTVREKRSKTRSSGFHYSEYPPECLSWYPLNGKSRYFLVEAAGSIDEENSDVSTCTEMTLLEELDTRSLALHTIAYMINHPKRAWQAHGSSLDISEERAECMGAPGIAIARGKDPKARGCAGTVIGLVREEGNNMVAAAYVAGEKGIRPGVWYGIVDGEVKPVET